MSLTKCHINKIKSPHGIMAQILTPIVTIMCQNDELSLTISLVGCLLKDSKLFIFFAKNSQIPLKIAVIPILIFIW